MSEQNHPTRANESIVPYLNMTHEECMMKFPYSTTGEYYWYEGKKYKTVADREFIVKIMRMFRVRLSKGTEWHEYPSVTPKEGDIYEVKYAEACDDTFLLYQNNRWCYVLGGSTLIDVQPTHFK